MTADKEFGARLRYVRGRWKLSQDALAQRAGVGVATIRRMEGRKFDPRLSTVSKLADALQVRVEWLLTGDEPMLSLAQMTVDEQHKAQSGPGTESLPGYVVLDGGVWYTDANGNWTVKGREGDTQAVI